MSYVKTEKTRSLNNWDTPENRMHYWVMRTKMCFLLPIERFAAVEVLKEFSALHYKGSIHFYEY